MVRLAAWFFSISLLAGGAVAETVSVTVARLESAPVIDGKLNDPCWKSAAKITDFHLLGPDGKKPSRPTEAWLGFDDKALYIAFRCTDEQAENVQCRWTQRDDPVHMDESVEIFLDPEGLGRSYYHLLLNAANIQADQFMRGGLRKRSWNGRWRSAVSKDEKGWSVEIAVPFSTLLENGVSGRPWGLNVAREKHTKPEEITTWAPVRNNFHDPASFGRLLGLEKLAPVFAPRIASVRVKGYEAGDAGYSYTLAVSLRNNSGKAGEVEIIAQDTPLSGPSSTAAKTVSIGAVAQVLVDLSVPVKRPAKRNVIVGIRVPGAAEWLQRVEPEDTSALSPVSFFLDRTYYTSEAEAKVLYQLHCPARPGDVLAAEILDKTGRVVARNESKQPRKGESAIGLPLGGVPDGTLSLRLRLCDKSGAVLVEDQARLRKLAPSKHGEVKIDRVNEVVLVDGKPFFPFGLYMTTLVGLKELPDAGFNCAVGWEYNLEEVSSEFLDIAHEAGLKVIETPTRFSRPGLRYADPKFRERFENFIAEKLPRIVKAVRAHPALLVYYGPDEPDLADSYFRTKGRSMHEMCSDYFRVLRREDPYHPLYDLFSGRVPDDAQWWETFDFAGVDIYWRPGADDGIRSTPLWMVEGTIQACGVGKAHRVPVWIVPNAERFSATVRPMTPPEQRCQTYLALIYGAKGLLYFVGPIQHQATWEVFKELSAEVKAITPALLTRTSPQHVTVEPETARDPFGFPPVHALLKRRPGGGEVLLVANSQPRPVRAEFALPFFGKSFTVRRMFKGGDCKVSDGTFADEIEGYGTRVYAITGSAWEPGEAADIRIKVSGKAVEYLAALAAGELPESLGLGPEADIIPVKDRKNLLADPGFETGEGWKFEDWGGDNRPVESTYSYETTGAHSGKRCVRITRQHTVSASQMVSDPIELKPHAVYRYGAWLRCMIREGRKGPEIFLLRDKGGIFARTEERSGRKIQRFVRADASQKEWRQFAETVTTGDEPVTVRMFCRLGNSVGEAWFDDAFIEKVARVPGGVAGLARPLGGLSRRRPAHRAERRALDPGRFRCLRREAQPARHSRGRADERSSRLQPLHPDYPGYPHRSKEDLHVVGLCAGRPRGCAHRLRDDRPQQPATIHGQKFEGAGGQGMAAVPVLVQFR